MDADLSNLMTYGIAAVLIGMVTLALLVRGDLLPPGSMEGGGRVFLGAALGIGVIAFAVKLIIIAVISTFPKYTIAPLVAGKSGARHTASPLKIPPDLPSPYENKGEPKLWQALPKRAPDPPDNPTTAEKVALGEMLFFDTNLSRDGTISCASCHDLLQKAGADGSPRATGIGNQRGTRNAPTVWNAAFQAVQFWDGRAHSLEQQAAGPPLNPVEMGMPSVAAVEERVKANAAYQPLFESAFDPGTTITIEKIAAAIAAYERTLITPDTPYDRFVHGDRNALTASQQRGMRLFQTIGCIFCHSGPNFSTASKFGRYSPYRLFPAHNNPYIARYDLLRDKGKSRPNGEKGIWRVPSLRNVALTAPYFHNGSVNDLREAVRIMAVSQLNVLLSNDANRAQPLDWKPERRAFGQFRRRVLGDRDIDDIASFLESLSSDRLKRRISRQ